MQPRKSKPDWTIANSTATPRRAAAVTNETLCLDPGIAGARQKAMSVSFLMRRLSVQILRDCLSGLDLHFLLLPVGFSDIPPKYLAE